MQRKILIIKFGALGDVFLAEGQVRAIMKRHQGDSITILTEPAMLAVFEPMAKKIQKKPIEFILIVRKYYWLLPKLILRLWLENFDRVYDLQCSNYSSRLYSYLWKKPLWNGVVKNIWQDKSDNRNKVHAVKRFNRQLSYAGVSQVMPPRADYLHGKKYSFFKQKYFVLVIGGSMTKVRKKQIWSLDNFIHIAKWLEQKNIMSVIVGSRLEEKKAEQFIASVPSAINLVAQAELGDIAEVFRHAIGVVGNDTGLTHLSAIIWQDRLRTHRLLTHGFYKKKTRKSPVKKSMKIIALVAPPSVPDLMRPLGEEGKAVHVLYHKKINMIKPDKVIAILNNYIGKRQ